MPETATPDERQVIAKRLGVKPTDPRVDQMLALAVWDAVPGSSQQSNQPSQEPSTLQGWADWLKLRYQETVEGILKFGQTLKYVNVKVGHGKWERLFKGSKRAVDVPFPFSVQTARKYIQLAEHFLADANRAYARALPTDWATMYEVMQVQKEDPLLFIAAVADGRINPGMGIGDAKALRNTPKPESAERVVEFVNAEIANRIDEAMFAYALRGQWAERRKLTDRLSMAFLRVVQRYQGDLHRPRTEELLRDIATWVTEGGDCRRWVTRADARRWTSQEDLHWERRLADPHFWQPLTEKPGHPLGPTPDTHALKLFFAGSFHDKKEELLIRAKVGHRLVSFGYMEKELDPLVALWDSAVAEGRIQRRPEFFIDSGAYTDWTKKKKKKVDLQQYADFILARPGLFTVVANLDVIPKRGASEAEADITAAEGWENYRRLKALLAPAGIVPMHVYHQHEHPRWLMKLMDEAEYFGISPEEKAKEPQQMAWLEEVVMPRVTDYYGRPIRKIHGFGVTGKNLIAAYPWYSTDSTSWLATTYSGNKKKGSEGAVLVPGLGRIVKEDIRKGSVPKGDYRAYYVNILSFLDLARNCRPFKLGTIEPDIFTQYVADV